MKYVELYAKTNYSFLEGASHPEEMVQEATERGYEGIAITDRNGVYGIPRAYGAAKSLRLLTGSEITLNDQRIVLLA